MVGPPQPPAAAGPLLLPAPAAAREPAGVGPSIDARSLNDFIVLGGLGKGTFASVRQVVHRATSTVCALKTVRRERALREGGTPEVLAREATLQLDLRHRNIVRLYSCFEDAAQVHFVLEYVSGGQLLARMREVGRLQHGEAAHVLSEVAEGLLYLHGHNIVHRDIKPENVLLQPDPERDEPVVKIGDFGCCALLTELEPTRGTICGTMDYLAPEMIDQRPHDHGVDLWAVGVLLYEMLVGEPPFKASSQIESLRRIIATDLRCPAWLNADAADLAHKLMRHESGQRLPLAEALRHDFVVANTKRSSGAAMLSEPDQATAPAAMDETAVLATPRRSLLRSLTPVARRPPAQPPPLDAAHDQGPIVDDSPCPEAGGDDGRGGRRRRGRLRSLTPPRRGSEQRAACAAGGGAEDNTLELTVCTRELPRPKASSGRRATPHSLPC